MNKNVLIIVVLIVIGVIAFFFFFGIGNNEESQINPPSQQLDTGPADASGTDNDLGETGGTGDTSVESVIPELGGVVVLAYTDAGFNPGVLTVEKGTTVEFRSEGNLVMWPASVVHPTHTVYPGTDIKNCFDGSDTSSMFDSCGDVESYSFTFNEVGTWKYHNHRRFSHVGTIIVE